MFEKVGESLRKLEHHACTRRFLLFPDNRPLNVIEEVGRDPLRVSANIPPGQVLSEARTLALARKALEEVLPQPQHRN